jgi:hypothetical protein
VVSGYYYSSGNTNTISHTCSYSFFVSTHSGTFSTSTQRTFPAVARVLYHFSFYYQVSAAPASLIECVTDDNGEDVASAITSGIMPKSLFFLSELLVPTATHASISSKFTGGSNMQSLGGPSDLHPDVIFGKLLTLFPKYSEPGLTNSCIPPNP